MRLKRLQAHSSTTWWADGQKDHIEDGTINKEGELTQVELTHSEGKRRNDPEWSKVKVNAAAGSRCVINSKCVDPCFKDQLGP